jgi:hypothetical protein
MAVNIIVTVVVTEAAVVASFLILLSQFDFTNPLLA